MVLMDLSTLNVKVGKSQWIYPCLLFLDARSKVEKMIQIWVQTIRQKLPKRSKKSIFFAIAQHLGPDDIFSTS